MIKVSGSKTVDSFSDGGLVENCTFKYTAGIAPQWYVGGVDAHKAKDWVIRNNTFEDITSPENRLTEGAVHFWSDSANTLVEGNTVIDCDRGIMFGLDNSNHYKGIIRNNFIHVNRDVGVYLCNALGTQVYNNTIYADSDYPNAIEYRFEATNVAITNNITNKPIISRNGGNATLSSNVDYATPSWFIDPTNGDMHLKEAIYVVIDQGVDVDGLVVDWDGDLREAGKVDIGADEALGLAVLEIESVLLEADKTEIVNNGKDKSLI